MKLHEAILGAAFCAFGVWMILQSAELPKPRHLQYGPSLFPMLIGAGLAVCGALQMVSGLLNWRAEALVERPSWLGHRSLMLNLATIPAACFFYYFTAEDLGFVLTGLIIMFVMLLVGGVAPVRAAIVSLIMILLASMIFVSILHVPLPWGVLAPISGWFIW